LIWLDLIWFNQAAKALYKKKRMRGSVLKIWRACHINSRYQSCILFASRKDNGNELSIRFNDSMTKNAVVEVKFVIKILILTFKSSYPSLYALCKSLRLIPVFEALYCFNYIITQAIPLVCNKEFGL
jgi:hypothetical protein